MIPSTLKELARITALEELVDTANRLLHEQGCELETLETRILELANTLDYKANSVDDALKAIAGALAETLYCSVEQMMEYEAAKDAALAENARLRALLNAQDEYAHSGAYVPLVKTEFMGDGD